MKLSSIPGEVRTFMMGPWEFVAVYDNGNCYPQKMDRDDPMLVIFVFHVYTILIDYTVLIWDGRTGVSLALLCLFCRVITALFFIVMLPLIWFLYVLYKD